METKDHQARPGILECREVPALGGRYSLILRSRLGRSRRRPQRRRAIGRGGTLIGFPAASWADVPVNWNNVVSLTTSEPPCQRAKCSGSHATSSVAWMLRTGTGSMDNSPSKLCWNAAGAGGAGKRTGAGAPSPFAENARHSDSLSPRHAERSARDVDNDRRKSVVVIDGPILQKSGAETVPIR